MHERYGYDLDGRRSDGSFHYTGEGQVGDQEMTRGNKAILHHVDRGLRWRLFEEARRSQVRYVGEFVLDEALPYYRSDAPDRNNETRSVLVFRLWPASGERASAARSTPVARTHVRTGLGQILDYERYVEHRSRALLVPAKLSEDLVELLVRHRVACIWRTEEGGFERVDPPGGGRA